MKSEHDKLGTPDQGFNIVCTTYRLTEHYHYWTKNNPMIVQLVPEPFVEIPVELATEMRYRRRRQDTSDQRSLSIHGESNGHKPNQADVDRRKERFIRSVSRFIGAIEALLRTRAKHRWTLRISFRLRSTIRTLTPLSSKAFS